MKKEEVEADDDIKSGLDLLFNEERRKLKKTEDDGIANSGDKWRSCFDLFQFRWTAPAFPVRIPPPPIFVQPLDPFFC